MALLIVAAAGREDAAKQTPSVSVEEAAVFNGSALVRPTDDYREWLYVRAGYG